MFIKNIYKNNDNKVVVCDTTRNGGIFIEVAEKEVPIEERGGCGVDTSDIYFRSNTAGETNNKYFKKVNDIIRFYPKKYYEEMKNSKVINLEVARKYLNEYSKKSNSIKFNISEHDKYIRIYLRVRINEKDLAPLENDYMEYSESFRKCFVYSVSIDIILKNNNEEIKKIKEVFNNDRLILEKNIKNEEVDLYIDKLKKLNENGHLVFSETQV